MYLDPGAVLLNLGGSGWSYVWSGCVLSYSDFDATALVSRTHAVACRYVVGDAFCKVEGASPGARVLSL